MKDPTLIQQIVKLAGQNSQIVWLANHRLEVCRLADLQFAGSYFRINNFLARLELCRKDGIFFVQNFIVDLE